MNQNRIIGFKKKNHKNTLKISQAFWLILLHCNQVRVYIYVSCWQGFSDGSASKESACNPGDTRDVGWIPGLGRHPGGGNGNPFQCSFLENPMDRRNLLATVHGAIKSWTGWSDWMHAPTYPHTSCSTFSQKKNKITV